jgi:hypothetical protein
LSDFVFHFYNMKDTMMQQAMQEKNNKTPKNVLLSERRCQAARLSGVDTTAPDCPLLPAARYSEMDVGFRPGAGASSYPDTSGDHSSATDRRTVPGTQTVALSALLGWSKHRRLLVLCYQYQGDSESGLKPAGAPDNWRCLAVEHLSQVELLDDPWQTAENHSRPQRCIQEVELDVDAYPERVPPAQSPNPKSAKL